MLTPKISGIFDVRVFDEKKEHKDRKIKANDDNITFSTIFPMNEVPEVFLIQGNPDGMLKARISRREKQAAEAEGREAVADSYAAVFKIGTNCKWFDKYGKPCDRPTNEQLDANNWRVQIDFNRKEKDPAKPLSPSGYWVNAIMVTVVEENPFDGQAFEVEYEAPADEPETDEEEEDLPF